MAIRTPSAVAALALLLIPLAACSSHDEAPTPKPVPKATASGSVPTTTQRVYLAVAAGCSLMGTADFAPLKVEGPDYFTTVKPTQGCMEQQIFSSFVYDVPMPKVGTLKLTPGNQPPVEVEADRTTKGKAVTVHYAHDSGDRYMVTTMEYDKSDDVANAA